MMPVASPGPAFVGLPVDPRAVSRSAPRGDWVGFWLLVALAFMSGWYAGYLNREVGIPVRPTQAACPPGSISCPVPPPPSKPQTVKVTIPAGRAKPWEATVRISVGSGRSVGVGTGTIIDGRVGFALVMTAAHLFDGPRGYVAPSKFTDRIRVETFEGESFAALTPGPEFSGKLLDVAPEREVALVTFATRSPLPASPLVPAAFRVDPGTVFFSMGCNAGQIPSAWSHRLRGEFVGTIHHDAAMNNRYRVDSDSRGRYHALVIEPKPIQGRSGGGLFTVDGMLAGVCNSAFDSDSAGLYASETGMRFILARNETRPVATDADPDGSPGRDESQAGHRPKPTPQAPPASGAATPDPSGSLHAGASWVERAIGLDPLHLQAGGVLALIAWYFRGRSIGLPRLTSSPPVPTAPPPPSDPWDRVMQALEAAAIADARAQEAAAKASERAKVSDEIKTAVARMIRPTQAPAASSALVGA